MCVCELQAKKECSNKSLASTNRSRKVRVKKRKKKNKKKRRRMYKGRRTKKLQRDAHFLVENALSLLLYSLRLEGIYFFHTFFMRVIDVLVLLITSQTKECS